MEKEIEKYYQMRGKEVIDTMFEAGIFKESVSRDDMQGYEDLIAYMFQVGADSARKIAEFSLKYKK